MSDQFIWSACPAPELSVARNVGAALSIAPKLFAALDRAVGCVFDPRLLVAAAIPAGPGCGAVASSGTDPRDVLLLEREAIEV